MPKITQRHSLCLIHWCRKFFNSTERSSAARKWKNIVDLTQAPPFTGLCGKYSELARWVCAVVILLL